MFIGMVNRLRNDVLPAVERIVRRRRYSEGILPGLKSCGTTVEIRAVQKDRYRWETHVKEYLPEILDVAGVVSVHIGLDKGMPRDFYFQGTEADLDLLISQFQAAKKDLRALQEFLPTWKKSSESEHDH